MAFAFPSGTDHFYLANIWVPVEYKPLAVEVSGKQENFSSCMAGFIVTEPLYTWHDLCVSQ
jgi:hypothetical protein